MSVIIFIVFVCSGESVGIGVGVLCLFFSSLNVLFIWSIIECVFMFFIISSVIVFGVYYF